MMIRAYDEDYVMSAQRILGDMMDFAVNTLEYDGDTFFTMFLISGLAHQFGSGNPSYVAGRTGCELAREVLRESGLKEPSVSDEMYMDKLPEYWSGWALAYYQWYTGRTFARIHKAVSIAMILDMYPRRHEADIMKFVAIMDEKLRDYYTETNLKRLRTAMGLSQRELALLSGVAQRQIQLFEERRRDINKAQAFTIFKLGKALHCDCEDLLEI